MELRSTVEVGGEILAALEPYRERIFAQARAHGRREPYEAYAADALLALARSAANSASEADGSAPRATVHVRVDHAALVRGHVEAGETCEIPGVGPIPAATARTMAADAIVYGILTKGVEVTRVAHLGRRPTAAQRRALEARDPTCVVPGCEAREQLEIDHVTGWALTRTTKLDDRARLCSWHHHLKTHGGYRLEGPPCHWTWHPPKDSGRPARPPPDENGALTLDVGRDTSAA